MYFKYVFQLLVFQLLHNIAVCTLTVSGQHEVPGSLFREREREREREPPGNYDRGDFCHRDRIQSCYIRLNKLL